MKEPNYKMIVATLIADADKTPFLSIGHFAEHGSVSEEIKIAKAFLNYEEREFSEGERIMTQP